MADSFTIEHVKQLEEAIKKRYPKFEIRFKDKSWLMKLVGFFLFWNKRFMTHWATVRGQIFYFPSREKMEADPQWTFATMAHEYVHLADHGFAMRMTYHWPLYMSAFSLVALLAIWLSLWWLLALGFLVCLLPLPSPGKAHYEMRAYAMTLALNIWRGKENPDWLKEKLADNFTGWGYYKMWPFRKSVMERLDTYEILIKTRNMLRMSVAFEDVHKIVTGG